eukprot:gene1419-1645_t
MIATQLLSLLSLLLLIVGSTLAFTPPTLNGKVWHITDVHYDWAYAAGGNPSKMCHQVDTVIPMDDGTNVASPVGNYRCDSPLSLIEAAFEYMVKIEPNPDFIAWTGDDPPHVDTVDLNKTLVLQSIQNVTNFITSYFPNTRVFPSIGNNIRIGGYYTELAQPGFRIVSLNTVFYYSADVQCLNLTDPGDQLAWLNDTLYQARQNNEQVWIIGHVPPGHNEKYDVPNFHSRFNDRFLLTFANYSDVIVAHLYGHQHSDTFRLYYDHPSKIFENAVPCGAMFLSPSLTPWQNPFVPAIPNNPSLRIYSYNTTGFNLLDYDQYWSNLTQSIELGAIEFELEYRATQLYNIAALDPLSMFEAYLLMERDRAILTKFHLYNSVSYPTASCDEVCRKVQLCSIRHLYTEGFSECLVAGPRLSLQ